jgi:ribosome-binding factor A
MKAQRHARIDHEIARIMATLITQELRDPRLGFVTVTRAEISYDLHSCKIYVSIIGDRHVAKQSLDALEHAKKFLRGELGHKIDLRHTPELVFLEDRSTERAIALAKTLREDAERRGRANGETATAAVETETEEEDV